MRDTAPEQTALIIGASRGIGLGLAAEHLSRRWRVTATVRGSRRTGLHDLADTAAGRLIIEKVNIAEPVQVGALRERLAGTTFDLLVVNAAISNGDVPVGEVSTETFNEVMVTSALSPVRVVETFHDLVAPDGTIAVMSSSQGSITLNDRAGYEVYRASKSALNQLMRCFAARHADDQRTLLLVNPGHVRTELGGEGASLTVEESVAGVLDTVEQWAGRGGLAFIDQRGRTVPW